jgi:hypothetical protein
MVLVEGLVRYLWCLCLRQLFDNVDDVALQIILEVFFYLFNKD